jgi:hypothetical protein
MRLALLLVLALAFPATARASGEIYTLAGNGTTDPRVSDGAFAGRVGTFDHDRVAALPGGGFLLSEALRIWRVDPQGVMRLVAGNGHDDTSGDGGPARRAALAAGALTALPDGGFLIADDFGSLVRKVDAGGTITTIAGGIGDVEGDGVPAERADLLGVNAIAVFPDGSYVVNEFDRRARRIGTNGLIETVAGNGKGVETAPDLHGQPATSVPIDVEDLAAMPDGSLLIADGAAHRVDRVAADGSITVAASRPGDPTFKPRLLAPEPGGGFLVVTGRQGRMRIWRVAADGSMSVIAGAGPFTFTGTPGLEQRLAGLDALGADLREVDDIDVLPDGGVLFSEGTGDPGPGNFGGLIRYIAPPAPAVLAAAILRDRDRLLGSGGVSVALSRPATVTLTAGGHTITTALPAGISRIPLALTSKQPVAVQLEADADGQRRFDLTRLYPSPWLSDDTAALIAYGVRRTVLPTATNGNGGVGPCERRGAVRVDCQVYADRHCRRVAIEYSGGRLRWGTSGCRHRSRPRLRALRRRDWKCRAADDRCPPELFGKVEQTALLPSD